MVREYYFNQRRYVIVLQIRPGGLAAFPVDVTVVQEGMAVEEEGLTVMVEVNRGLKPTHDQIEELCAFIRSTVSGVTDVTNA